jgi:hypothetical protein
MQERIRTTKISPYALKLVRLISAMTGERQWAVMDRLLEVEARRLGLPTERTE